MLRDVHADRPLVYSRHSRSSGRTPQLPHLRRDWTPHLRRDWAHPSHIYAGTGLTPATSAPGLGSPLPHLRRDLSQAQQDLLRFKRDLERAHDEQAHALQAAPHATTGPPSA